MPFTTNLDMDIVEREVGIAQIMAREKLPARAETAPQDLEVNLVVVFYDREGVCGYGVTLRDGQITGLRIDSKEYQWFFHGQDRARSNQILRQRKPRITHKQVVIRSVRGGWIPQRKEPLAA